MFEFNDFEVIGEALNSDDAINIFRGFETKPDLTILDYRMTPKNGLEIMAELFRIDESAKIIIVSADFTVSEKALDQGAKSFLLKPVKEEKLINEIIKICQ